ncbi:hypothetical protein JD844_004157 [Phrynosoma platyrhinos]|uniref:COMM domain-containing protein 5 n=1 Tax=Phrynosoma platyrhinos TaxID=52577 RepID=A0ABQ7TLZ6_PHRPL|nr:hypothetical protein JD844_004157 [Phrynosoma platyrhinos]
MERSPGIWAARDLGSCLLFCSLLQLQAASCFASSCNGGGGESGLSPLLPPGAGGRGQPGQGQFPGGSAAPRGGSNGQKPAGIGQGDLQETPQREPVKMIAESANLSDEQLAVLISGMYTLLREALRLPTSSLKQEVFKEDLKELRIPEDFIVDFATVAFGNRRPTLEAAIQKQSSQLPKIEDFKWRVDVAISTSSLARALQPSILMQLKVSDGSAHRFEVPVAKFQELRYNVALILKEMNDLEKRSILKIQD